MGGGELSYLDSYSVERFDVGGENTNRVYHTNGQPYGGAEWKVGDRILLTVKTEYINVLSRIEGNDHRLIEGKDYILDPSNKKIYIDTVVTEDFAYLGTHSFIDIVFITGSGATVEVEDFHVWYEFI